MAEVLQNEMIELATIASKIPRRCWPQNALDWVSELPALKANHRTHGEHGPFSKSQNH